MQVYLDMVSHILAEGEARPDRTGVGTLSVFGYKATYELWPYFPLVTTARKSWRNMAIELLWMLSGSTSAHKLQEQGNHIWDEWADQDGELGPIYGAQFRKWRGPDGLVVDQIAGLVKGLREQPWSRRHIVSAWNVAELDKMALPPCHAFWQCYVGKCRHCQGGSVLVQSYGLPGAMSPGMPHDMNVVECPNCKGSGYALSIQLTQRSMDICIGAPYNIGEYAMLAHMLASITRTEQWPRGIGVGRLEHAIGDAHIYLNHIEGAQLQLERQPMPLPILWVNPLRQEIGEFGVDDIEVRYYKYWPTIHFPIAV